MAEKIEQAVPKVREVVEEVQRSAPRQEINLPPGEERFIVKLKGDMVATMSLTTQALTVANTIAWLLNGAFKSAYHLKKDVMDSDKAGGFIPPEFIKSVLRSFEGMEQDAVAFGQAMIDELKPEIANMERLQEVLEKGITFRLVLVDQDSMTLANGIEQYDVLATVIGYKGLTPGQKEEEAVRTEFLQENVENLALGEQAKELMPLLNQIVGIVPRIKEKVDALGQLLERSEVLNARLKDGHEKFLDALNRNGIHLRDLAERSFVRLPHVEKSEPDVLDATAAAVTTAEPALGLPATVPMNAEIAAAFQEYLETLNEIIHFGHPELETYAAQLNQGLEAIHKELEPITTAIGRTLTAVSQGGGAQ